jgi:hypothetical protein
MPTRKLDNGLSRLESMIIKLMTEGNEHDTHHEFEDQEEHSHNPKFESEGT